MSKSSSSAPFGDARYQKLVKEIEENGGTATFPTEEESTVKSIGNALKKATSRVGSALTLKPKVVKAPDPTSLSSMPDKISVNVYYQAGRVAESNGNMAAAIKQYSRVLQEQPTHIPSLISLARLNDRQNYFKKAEELYRRAIKVQPENTMAYNDLGLCLARQKRYPEAVQLLTRAVELDPDRKLYHNNLATVLVETGRVDDAWSELVSVHPVGIAHYNLGYLLFKDGKKQEARRQFALAAENDASLEVARQMLATLDAERDPAETPATPTRSEQTAQSGKVRFRVEDAPVRRGNLTQYDRGLAQQPTEEPAARKRIEASPVAMVLSPRELRRIPPTGSPVVQAPEKPPVVRLREPVPLTPGQDDRAAAPASDPTQPSAARMQYPIRTLSGYIAEEDDAQSDLPTPGILDSGKAAEPKLLPPVDAAAAGQE